MTKKKKTKCKYEDQVQCKEKRECPNFHPIKTCLPYSKLGNCPNMNSCNYRHPRKPCFQWQKEGKCSRGDKCYFRHPVEQMKKTFLEKGQNPNLNPPMMMNMLNPLMNIPPTMPLNFPPSPWMNNPWQLQSKRN